MGVEVSHGGVIPVRHSATINRRVRCTFKTPLAVQQRTFFYSTSGWLLCQIFSSLMIEGNHFKEIFLPPILWINLPFGSSHRQSCFSEVLYMKNYKEINQLGCELQGCGEEHKASRIGICYAICKQQMLSNCSCLYNILIFSQSARIRLCSIAKNIYYISFV